MRLDDGKGTRLALDVVGYQFPEIRDHDTDSNWLMIAADVETPVGSWKALHACLLTWEVGWLAMWLDNVASGKRQSHDDYFLEPNLEFEHRGTTEGGATLRVLFSHGLRPPWLERAYEEQVVDLTVSPAQLRQAAASLRDDLNRFPPRAGAERKRPFVPPAFLPSFALDWMLAVPAGTPEEAEAAVHTFAQLLDLPASIRETCPHAERPGVWYVLFTQPIPVPFDDYGEALLVTLSHFPNVYGLPGVGGPLIWPDGCFDCDGTVDMDFSVDQTLPNLAGHFHLTNHESPRRWRGWVGLLKPD